MKHDSLLNLLAARLAAAIATVTGRDPATVDPAVRPAGDAKFGDYQCNAAMALARELSARPRDVAERIKAAVEPALADVIAPLEIAGPGFLNIRLRDEFLARYLEEIPAPPPAAAAPAVAESSADSLTPWSTEAGAKPGAQPGAGRLLAQTRRVVSFEPLAPNFDRVGLPPVERPQRVVVEYSQPNIAKQMHVGHLRSTIIGDVFARVLAFEGHDVVRQNHIGDWGTQFGMLIRWYREHPLPTPPTHEDVLEAIEADYRAANERFQTDATFAAEARRAVAELQGGDPAARRVWEQICAVSWQAFTEIYERLGVLLRPEDVRGESFYNPQLPEVIARLRAAFSGGGAAAADPGAPRGALREDQGALVVYLYDARGAPLFRNPEGEILGMIVQKSDGAYLYATTDLAALHYRLTALPFRSGVGAERIIYVTDARQKLHFQQFFACARAAGWITGQQVEHVTFGSVLGPDRRPLKTRAGGTIKLRELLDEAERRALDVLRQRAPGDGDGDLDPTTIARAVGIAAVKYADLRNDRNADYVFDWDKMLALSGNTAPYLLYAYARIRSIYRKAAARYGAPDVYAPHVRLRLAEPAERALALRLTRFREEVDKVAADLTPHTLCTYLYDLAADFMRFYETCAVLDAADAADRLSRMRLCDLTARTLKLGLLLLGIDVLERM